MPDFDMAARMIDDKKAQACADAFKPLADAARRWLNDNHPDGDQDWIDDGNEASLRLMQKHRKDFLAAFNRCLEILPLACRCHDRSGSCDACGLCDIIRSEILNLNALKESNQ